MLCGAMLLPMAVNAVTPSVASPDGRLQLTIESMPSGGVGYAVTYDGKRMLDASPLGFVANTGNFVDSLSITGSEQRRYIDDYTLDRSKTANVHYEANELRVNLANNEGNSVDVLFRVSDNDEIGRAHV